MDSPFIYDKYVTGKNFIGRKNDCTVVGNLISQGEHVVLSSPAKTGKKSLIQQTLFNLRMSGHNLRIGQFSALNVRTVEDFIVRFGSAVLRMRGSTPHEYNALISKHLERTHMVFDPKRFSENDEVLSLSWEADEEDVRAVIDLPYRIAAEKGTRHLLIIEEFQNLTFIGDGDRIFRLMEEVMKKRKEAGQTLFSFVFMGSMVNAMRDIFFTHRHFYRLTEQFKMQPFDEREITDHVAKGFLTSGKVIDKELLLGVCRLFKNHLWYINHFVSICDAKSKGYIMEPVLLESLGCILAIHEPRFISIMSSLTTHQVNLLRAVIDGHTRFSSSEVVRQYSLNSSANVKRVKDALMKKEILAFDENDEPSFLDPLFEYWVRHYFFEKKNA